MKSFEKNYVAVKTIALFLSILSLFYVVSPVLGLIQKVECYNFSPDATRSLADNSYFGNANTRTVIAENGFYEEYQYNSIDKVEKIWYNYDDGYRENAYSYDYNENGKLSKFTNHIDGEETEYGYDAAGRLVSWSGSMDSIAVYKNDYTIEYDSQGRISETVNMIDYPTSSLNSDLSIRTTHEYNANGTLNEGESYYNLENLIKSEYTYDDLCRLVQIYSYAENFNHTISYTYYPEEDYTEEFLNTYTSNINGAITEYTYNYDTDGNITSVVEGNGNIISYTYNASNQLVTETHGDTTTTYTYDDFGNITSITVTEPRVDTVPDPGFGPIIHWALVRPQIIDSKVFEYESLQNNDRLTSLNGIDITYDEIGNPKNYYNGTSYHFTWRGKRLASATSGSKNMSFSYNDEGARTKKTVNGVVTKYYLFGSKIMSEKTDTRTIVYIYDAAYSPVGMMYRERSYAEDEFDVFWFEKNILGDVIAVYDNNGTKLVTYTYTDSFGNHTVTYSNGGASTGAIYNPFRHRSYYYDNDLEMYYLDSRYYDAKICRFISPYSNSAIEQGIPESNTYSYCFNNPINYICYAGSIFFPFWELTWPGEIHRKVQLDIYNKNKEAYRCEVEVSSGNQKGRIDLLKSELYAYEIKPITTSTYIAEDQLQRYICLSGGKYHIGINQPELTGTVTSEKGYKAEYEFAGNGIIRYQFIVEQKVEELSYETIFSKVTSPNSNEVSASIGDIMVFGYYALGGMIIYACLANGDPMLKRSKAFS